LAGEVELRVRAEPREPVSGQAAQTDLMITVRDTGQGMSPAQLEKLFEEYTRFNSEANRAVEGVGLGMSITHYLVNAMGGEIAVESEPDKGTVFTVRLPQEIPAGFTGVTELTEVEVIGKERSEDLRKFRISKAYAKKEDVTRNKQMPSAKILSVDDMETNLYVIKGLLAVYDISAETAMSGFEAIEKLEAGEEYDIIFMDHMMPYMNGVQTTEKIRKMGYTLPVIALTANAVTGTREMFLENGFDDFLSKPIDMDELNNILEKWIPAEKQEEQEYQESLEYREPDEPAFDDGTGNGNAIKIDGVDTDTGILMTGGTIEGYLHILRVYYSDGREKVKQLESCLERNDLIMYTIHAHALKGASVSIGALALSETAANLEAAGKRRDLKYIQENNSRFAEDLTKLLDNISPLIGDGENHEFIDDADRILLGL
jgi:CheY-like chemotaxis protein/HPt (histidine-containing phosphotransfer) domain-containing protein